MRLSSVEVGFYLGCWVGVEREGDVILCGTWYLLWYLLGVEWFQYVSGESNTIFVSLADKFVNSGVKYNPRRVSLARHLFVVRHSPDPSYAVRVLVVPASFACTLFQTNDSLPLLADSDSAGFTSRLTRLLDIWPSVCCL